MSTRSKSTLFLIEQLIVIAVFAICAVACVSILTSAFFIAHDSGDTSRALIRAESSAELFKASGANFQAVADLTGGTVSIGEIGEISLSVYYDRQWQVAAYEQPGGFVLNIAGNITAPGDFAQNPIVVQLSVSRVAGDLLISFPVAVRGNQSNR